MKGGEIQRYYLRSLISDLTGWKDPHVENQDTLTMLAELGVDYAQGYGISKPGPIEDSL